MHVDMTVNGVAKTLVVDPDETLLHALRERLHLTGTKDGCSEGECGACTVLIDGRPVDSCIYPAMAAADTAVRTVEGLAGPDGSLSPLQSAFIQNAAVQCGFCTPGLLMTLTALLERNPSPTEVQVREALNGNICRCTGYTSIVDAAMEAAEGVRA